MPRLRFTDCDKWKDPWYLDLPAERKLIWLYLCDQCDNAGVIDPSARKMAFELGFEVKLEEVIAWLGDRVLVMPNGKWYLTKYIRFQNPHGLSKSGPHQSIIRLLRRHGLDSIISELTAEATASLPPSLGLGSAQGRARVGLGYPEGSASPKEEDKDKEEDSSLLSSKRADVFDGMDGDATTVELAKPIPAALAPLKTNFKDWSYAHPRTWVNRGLNEEGNLADWQTLFDRSLDPSGKPEPFDRMYAALTANLPQSKRINYRSALEWLNAHYKDA